MATPMSGQSQTRAPRFIRGESIRGAGSGLRRERNGSRSGECRGEAGEHDEVGVKRDLRQPAHAQRRQPVVVLQAPELALDGSAAPVEVGKPLSGARDERVAAVGLDSLRGGPTLAGRRFDEPYPF